ncbi:signal peptidase II [Levilactobacillus bambusae]|uniref:Lipoprotein signal peptidase n=1 Tax=Levilactobacillus bambusae TaxID=2024736 RepID=A0A2V1N1F9_9LACO|nr:signal peptidase II [Levilactobacillus bambusae]PWG00863.1 signal peptidase II [Levilactobacillus bambusae]
MFIILIVAICLLILADQLIKLWVAASIPLGATHELIPNVISLTNLRNSGAAWSILEGQQWFFTLVTIIAIGTLGYFFWRYRNDRDNRGYEIGLAFMLAGTFGNFIDRVHNGYVIDMFQLDFINFPIFNFADLCLTVGVIIILITIIRDDQAEKF